MRLGGVAAKRQGLRASAIPADTKRQFLTNVLRCINEPSVVLASPMLKEVSHTCEAAHIQPQCFANSKLVRDGFISIGSSEVHPPKASMGTSS